MQIRIVFFIEICVCSQKLTSIRIFGGFVFFFSPVLSAPFPSLTINPIQFLCLQVSSSALLFVRGNHCQQPNTDGQSQSNLPANAPETGNAFTHYLQRKNILKLPWTLWICKKGKGLKMEQKILYLPFVCEYGFNYKLSELWNNSNWFGG